MFEIVRAEQMKFNLLPLIESHEWSMKGQNVPEVWKETSRPVGMFVLILSCQLLLVFDILNKMPSEHSESSH